MSQAHAALRRDHKLKHWARLQYGLFLKGAGMSLEDNMQFFQQEFTKIMSYDAFNKEHGYNWRHMYGKEGKRTNYTPYSCLKIIMGAAPNAGEAHGCPYRHYDERHLSGLLSQMRLDGDVKDTIVGHVRSKNFQLACQRHFEAVHPSDVYEVLGPEGSDGVGNHPNAWTAASLKYYKAKSDKEKENKEKLKAIAGGGDSQTQTQSQSQSPSQSQSQLVSP